MGLFDSIGGFLGLGGGPSMTASTGNQPLNTLNAQESLYDIGNAMNVLSAYGQGTRSSDQVLKEGSQLTPQQNQEMMNALATGATTGSRYATEQVQKNPILGSLFGDQGLMPKEIAKEQQLQNQGFQLQPEDYDLYGQASGNIARLFGSQGNELATDLASRGLAEAPSGVAGSLFSGLAGNKQEQLAKAQEAILQNRFQNTINQIKQQQSFIGTLGEQGANAIQQQYGRQIAGAQNQHAGLENAAKYNTFQNEEANNANLAANQFNAANKPMNFMDYATSGIGQGIQGGLAGNPGGTSTVTGPNGEKQTVSTKGSGSSGMVASLFG